MKRLLTAVCCACVVGVAGLSAQADKKVDKVDKDVKSMTVTGCVAEKDGHFMLNNATMAGETKSMAYDLMGGELKAHVGHKVEVMGTSDGKMAKDKMAKDSKMSQDKPMDKDKMAMSEAHATLNVKSVKMISPTCP